MAGIPFKRHKLPLQLRPKGHRTVSEWLNPKPAKKRLSSSQKFSELLETERTFSRGEFEYLMTLTSEKITPKEMFVFWKKYSVEKGIKVV